MMESVLPTGQLGDSDDVASVALLLASDSSTHVNGAEWFIDGGYTSV
jgi:NAD(P)-dependent dehydrogenase (short-subunit alcohol dehydrogenase family)